MGDRFDGALAGGGRSLMPEVSVVDAIHQLALNETLVTADESGDLVIFRAIQNPYHGGFMVTQESGEANRDAMTNAIKLSQMTSMLNDNDRCAKYAKALSHALQKRPESRVLDIGTGTGLLAMLAARAGAKHVDAVELFQPLADLATRVVEENRMQDKISVHVGASTDFRVAQHDVQTKDLTLPERADALVTEVFDSALLGENCLETISHARKNLLKENATVIPAKAALYGAVLQSEFCAKFNSLGSTFPFHRSENAKDCQGRGQGIPLHMEALEEGKDYDFLTEAVELFSFDFESQDLEECCERKQSRCIRRIRNGTPNTIVTWWELDLTGNGDVVYSTKPGLENWQDHWLTVFYPLLATQGAASNDERIPITMRHDRMSFSFTHGLDSSAPDTCTCGYHILPGGPYRIYELGDANRLASLQSNIKKAMEKASSSGKGMEENEAKVARPLRCIDISDSGICALLASKVAYKSKAVEIVSIEEDSEFSALLYKQVVAHQATETSHAIYIEYKPLSSFVEAEKVRKQDTPDYSGLDVVMSEPFTRAMSAYPLSTLCNLIIQRNVLADVLSPNAVMVPGRARVMAQAICFPKDTMQRSFGAIDEVQGLHHRSFSALYSDWPGEERVSLPLFQYRVSPSSAAVVLHEYDLCTFSPEQITGMTEGELIVDTGKGVDAVRLWVEYDGMEMSAVGRSEVSLVGEALKTQVGKSGRVVVRSGFAASTGTLTVCVQSRFS